MKIYKKPLHTDDSFYFMFEKNDVLRIPDDKEYLRTKTKAFESKNIDKSQFEEFKDRPSFYMLDSETDLSGTIYTHSAELKNVMTMESMIKAVKPIMHISRRCLIRLADPLCDYLDPTVNTSCLSTIHYTAEKCTLTFRASDMGNELIYDIYTILNSFIKPVYGYYYPEIHVFAMTAQNIIPIEDLFQ